MSVRAKFIVDSKTEHKDKYFSITLKPVTCGSEENKEFYKWTPSGLITLDVINTKVSDQFEIGKEYYIDFTKVE